MSQVVHGAFGGGGAPGSHPGRNAGKRRPLEHDGGVCYSPVFGSNVKLLGDERCV